MAEATTGSLLARALQDAAAGPIFTLNGGHIWGLYFGADDLGLRMVDVRHEQTAGFAAEGWARATRTVGVAAVTAGPGVTNAISAMAQARQNESPVLFIGGRAPTGRWGQGSLQEMDHVTVVGPIVKSAETVMSADAAYPAVAAAIETALTGRTGPVFVDVPADVFFGTAEEPGPEAGRQALANPGSEPDPEAVAAVVRLLSEARRPVLVAGTTVWWARAEAELRRLIEAARLPAVLNGMARGVLPPEHPLFATRARAAALAEADLLVLVGTPLDFRLNFGRPPVLSDRARLVYVDADAARRHRAGAAALDGDVRAALAALAEAARDVPDREEWLAYVAAAGAAAMAEDERLATSAAVPVHPARLVREVERFLDPDAIVVVDGGDFVSFAGRLLHRARPGLWLDGGPYGCLGSGPGYALGAKLAHPDRQVVLLSGDGAFGFAGMDFDTLVRHRVPIVCVIGNNGIWATEKHHPMQHALGSYLLTDLRPGTRYDLVVEALGGHGELVERPEEIGPALERAFKSGVPACVNVLTDPTAEYPRSSVLL